MEALENWTQEKSANRAGGKCLVFTDRKISGGKRDFSDRSKCNGKRMEPKAKLTQKTGQQTRICVWENVSPSPKPRDHLEKGLTFCWQKPTESKAVF